MCRQLKELLDKEKCRFSQSLDRVKNLDEFFEIVYNKHNQQPVEPQIRKRIYSQQSDSIHKESFTSDKVTASRLRHGDRQEM